ncbi:unnamed protein product [Allacma fusca]|uniref:Uncharacterized protein n=1 Tax=Allacma fusca TaxID=39272 RepID=A0A8J2J2L5_9HEXA|nr:unnamed protein product [Allacma fusca]
MSYSNTDVKMSRMIYSTDFMTGSWYPQLNRKSTKSNTLGIRDNFASFKHTLPTRTSKLNTLYRCSWDP